MDKPNPYESPVSDSDGITPKYDSHDELVVLSTFSSTVDAQMLIVHLSQHGIDSRMGNELSGSSLFGATLELAALREERLGIIYTGILGAGVVLIAIASFFLFGENFSYREAAGIGLVILGTALAWA